jgi:hypothetical protein
MKDICRAVVAFVLVLGARPAYAASYYIEEVTDFTGNGCQSTDVNTITATMQTALQTSGWTGQRWTNADSWPQDWREACSSTFGTGGLDSSWADNGWQFITYAGHGRVGGGNLFFGYPHNSVCDNWLGTNSRLGSMAGGHASVGAYMTSCTLKIGTLVSHANLQWLWQNLGFHDSPAITFNSAGAFFNCTSANTNASCWLLYMEENNLYDNSPIVVSYGETALIATQIRDGAKLKGQAYVNLPRPWGPSCGQGQPAFFYNYLYINNGSGPC